MFNFNLNGLAEWFKLGKQGPIIKKDGDKISFRNPSDSALINVQALDPVDLQDVITKQYFEDNSSLVPYQTSLSLFSNVLYTDASKQIGVNDMPANGIAYAVQIKVNTTFDGTNPTVTIGSDTTNNRLMELDKNDLTEGNLFYLTVSDIFSSAETIKAFVTPDSSTQGDLDITVLYSMVGEAPVGFGSKSVSSQTTNYTYHSYSAGGGIVPSSARTFTFWYKNTTGTKCRIAGAGTGSLGDSNFQLTINNSNELVIAGSSTRTLTSITNANDGQWHCIVIPCTQDFYLTTDKIYFDGVEVNFTAITFGGVDYIGDLITDYDTVSLVAQCDVFGGTPFTLSEAQEYYNGGVVLDPSTHSKSADLQRSYTFGDHPSDNTVQGSENYLVIVNTLNPTDEGSMIRVQIQAGTVQTAPVADMIVEDHPSN